MAKEDFCFTYYDGDAARDKAHMTRLERGGYDDIISAQRKFGRLTMDIIRRVLGSDFQSCWANIEIVMMKDEEGKYYIEWVENSVNSMRKNSKKQKEKIENYWNDVKSGKIQRNKKNGTAVIPQYKKEHTTEIPLEDVYGNEYVLEKEGGVGEEKPGLSPDGFFSDQIDKKISLSKDDVDMTIQYISIMCRKKLFETDVGGYWEAFKIQQLQKHEWYNGFPDLISHFRDFLKNQINKQNGSSSASTVGKTIEFDRP